MGKRIVHFEIPAEQPESLAKFYSTLFGWQIDKTPNVAFDYWICRTGEGPGIDGAIMKRMNPRQTLTNYVDVQQMDGFLERATALGGMITVPRSVVPGMGWYACVVDPQGNPVGLWQGDKEAK
jgi:predicted enzyme related to lactoylglutathione lyase